MKRRICLLMILCVFMLCGNSSCHDKQYAEFAHETTGEEGREQEDAHRTPEGSDDAADGPSSDADEVLNSALSVGKESSTEKSGTTAETGVKAGTATADQVGREIRADGSKPANERSRQDDLTGEGTKAASEATQTQKPKEEASAQTQKPKEEAAPAQKPEPKAEAAPAQTQESKAEAAPTQTPEAAPAPESAQAPEPAPMPEPEPAPTPEPASRRILFVGDSRTIDMFADSDAEISGMNANGIVVYARHGNGFGYLTEVVDGYGHDNFDVLVTWMGANDGGYFGNYEAYYNGLLNEGKTIVVCTVGPTDDSTLAEWDHPNYENDRMTAFNGALVGWAGAHGVQVIDLYSYILHNDTIDPADGIHYTPRPTTDIWSMIVGSL